MRVGANRFEASSIHLAMGTGASFRMSGDNLRGGRLRGLTAAGLVEIGDTELALSKVDYDGRSILLAGAVSTSAQVGVAKTPLY